MRRKLNRRIDAVQRLFVNVLLKVGPPVVAFAGVLKGALLTDWANSHETTLLLLLFALVGSLLHPQLRYIVITTLCYGVAFLAARDIFFPLGLPRSLHGTLLQHLRMAALFAVSVLTFTAAVAESITPGTVWSRRCYFGGAALYFLGTGAITYFGYHSWQSIMLLVTGFAALAGAIFAHRIVEMEKEDLAETPVSQDLTSSLQEAHKRALRAKEWIDPVEQQNTQPQG